MLRFLYINKIKFNYINDVWVKMLIGGVSTSGIKSLLKINQEILDACKKNGIYSNLLLIYLKYIVKWVGFFKSKNK